MGSLKWLEGAFDHRSRVLITACFTWDDDPGLSTVQNFSARRTTQRLCALDTLIKGRRTNLRLRHIARRSGRDVRDNLDETLRAQS
jgi:hypothetical protein